MEDNLSIDEKKTLRELFTNGETIEYISIALNKDKKFIRDQLFSHHNLDNKYYITQILPNYLIKIVCIIFILSIITAFFEIFYNGNRLYEWFLIVSVVGLNQFLYFFDERKKFSKYRKKEKYLQFALSPNVWILSLLQLFIVLNSAIYIFLDGFLTPGVPPKYLIIVTSISFIMGLTIFIERRVKTNYFSKKVSQDLFDLYIENGESRDYIKAKLNLTNSEIDDYLKTSGKYDEYINQLYEIEKNKLESFAKDIGKDKDFYLQRIEKLKDPKFVLRLISHHEDTTIELKQTFFTDAFTNLKNFEREHDIVKAVSGLLNAFGGYVIVGVKDDKEIVGIEKDDFKDIDKYILKSQNLFKKCLTEYATQYISIQIVNIEKEKKVCLIHCAPSSKPIYCKHKEYNTGRKGKNPLPQDYEFFYVRSNAETIEKQMEEAHKYINDHFD